MKVQPNDLGICGVEQLLYAGKIAYNTTGASTGVELCKLPHDVVITRAVAVVGTAFNAGTTNVLTVGSNDDCDNLLGSSDITEGTAGAYTENTFVEAAKGAKIKAKYTQTGTAASAGEAEIYIFAVGIPEVNS
jgi:hypothetical protein